MRNRRSEKKGMGKRILCTLFAGILLCACQAGTPPDGASDSAFTPQSENVRQPLSESTERVSDTASSTESGGVSDTRRPSAPSVCEVPFTQTDNFPLPFEGELIWDTQMLADRDKGVIFPVEQALYDYDTMWLLLEENCPYLNVIQKEQVADCQAVKEEYRQQMARKAVNGYVTQKTFIDIIRKCLNEFQSVGHLYLIGLEDYAHYWDLYHSIPGYGLYENLAGLIDNPRSRAFYSGAVPSNAGSPLNSVSQGEPDEEQAAPIYGSRAITENIMTGFVGDGIPYLRIVSFMESMEATEREKLYAELPQYFADIAQADHLIIDIRGNGGGSTTVWQSGIVPFLEQIPLKREMFAGSKSGKLNQALDPTITDGAWRYGTRYTDESWQTDFPYIAPEALEGVDVFLKYSRTFPKDTSQKYFSGKIWLLIDKGCYSAADGFASFCKETGFATLIGSPTTGNGKGFDPLLIALPYSGLLIRYEAYITFNADGTCNGITGTQPDIPTAEGMDALETCLQMIQEFSQT